MENKTPEDVKPDFFYRKPYKYHPGATAIMDADGYHVLDIRGWGRIQKMDNAEDIQDKFGMHVAELLNNASELTKLREENERLKKYNDQILASHHDIEIKLSSQLSKAKELLEKSNKLVKQGMHYTIREEIEQFLNEQP